MSSTTLPQFRRSLGWVGLGFVLGALAGFAAFWWQFHKQARSDNSSVTIDWKAIYRMNNLGVGYMEQCDYPQAIKSFEKVGELAPDWLPGKINLGIALIHSRGTEKEIPRARFLFEEIVKRDSNNPYAHFCLGMWHQYHGDDKAARNHFEAVTKIDPYDPDAWLRLGNLEEPNSDRALTCVERAFELDPYLKGAIYGLAQELTVKEPKRKQSLLKEFQGLNDADWANPSMYHYPRYGKYTECIGRERSKEPAPKIASFPRFLISKDLQIRLAPGARWATGEDLRKCSDGELRVSVRKRFGATMVALDYNRDGKPDLFLLQAVVENGQVRDLLLHNDGGTRFTDVTTEAGLGGARPSLGCSVADFDNNGYSDLLITGIGQQWLFRNNGKGTFEDVTSKSGLNKLTSVCLGSAFVDLDQDGNLDLIIAQYAASPEEALAALQEKPKVPASGGPAVFLNVGGLPAAQPTFDPSPCEPKFRRLENLPNLAGLPGSTVNFTVSDLDDDHDLDLLVLADGQRPAVVLNDRLLRFRRVEMTDRLFPNGRWNGALVLDVNHDGRSDLFIVGPGQKPILLLSNPWAGKRDVRNAFEPGNTDSPPLLQAQAIDIDYDGWTDVIGLSDEHVPVLLQNDGSSLVQRVECIPPDSGLPKDLIGIRVGRFGLGEYQDLMMWSETQGLHLYLDQGNHNQALNLELTGHRMIHSLGSISRSNSDGFGTWVAAQVEDFWTGAEYTTLSAGLGQSRQPLVLGLGRHEKADVFHLRWPDNRIQGEIDFPASLGSRLEQNIRDSSW